MRSYFIFNGTDSREMGVILEGETPLQRAKERVTQVTIPSRSGVLHIEEGEDIFEPYIQSVNIAVRGGYEQIRRVLRWLKGAGEVSFSNDPNHKQDARIINAVSLSKVSPLLEWYKGTVQFYCQPFKSLLGEITQSLSESCTVVNDGDVSELPVFTLRGEGVLTLTVNGSTFSVTVSDGQGGAVIDCDVRRVTTLNGSELITAQSDGDFPTLDVGRNSISHTAEAAEIGRRRRYL